MLGQAIMRAFEDLEVTAWDREHLDITDERAVAERVPLLEPDLIINAAAYTDVEKAETESAEADAVNGYAVGNLAVAASDMQRPLVHISTDFVFSGDKQESYTENDEPESPLNAYGRSKLLGESLLREAGRDFWLVRSAWLFGLGKENFVTKIRRALRRGSAVPVVEDQVGSPTFTLDLARAIRELVNDRPPFGIYHLVNRGRASRADVAEEIRRLTGLPGSVRRVRTPDLPVLAPRPLYSVLRNTKRPRLRPWQAALREYLRMDHGSA